MRVPSAMMTEGRSLRVLAVLGLAVLAGCSGKAQGSASHSCSGMRLATIGDTKIGWRDVRQAQGQVKLFGGQLSDRDALIDVLWQDLGRQRLELPGGSEIYQSRRQVVRRYKSIGDGRRDGELEFKADRVPSEAKLTACGNRVLQQRE